MGISIFEKWQRDSLKEFIEYSSMGLEILKSIERDGQGKIVLYRHGDKYGISKDGIVVATAPTVKECAGKAYEKRTINDCDYVFLTRNEKIAAEYRKRYYPAKPRVWGYLKRTGSR